jgi:membrane fusion protein (multidrug efflux system)
MTGGNSPGQIITNNSTERVQCPVFRISGLRAYRMLPQYFLSLVLAALLSGCSKPEAPKPPPPEVTVMSIEAKDSPVTFEFVGITESSQQVEVRARVDGFLDDRLYAEGSIVKKGDVMFRMDAKPFEAQLDAAKAALAEQEARLWTAQADLKRVKPLAKANAVSLKELDDSQGRVNAAAAAVEMARADVETAKLNLGYTTVYAPVTGASSFARIQNGAYVDQKNSLLTYVAQLDPIWVDFSVSEDQLLSLRSQRKKGQLQLPDNGMLDIELVMADGSLYPETGKIFFRDANYSTETGTFLIRATFANPDQELRPGQFVRVRVKGMIRPDAILVPQQAVLQGAQGFFVWIVDGEGKAQTRNVEVGDWQDDNWFVYRGLSGGDRLITDGIVRLASGTPVKVVQPEAGASEGAVKRDAPAAAENSEAAGG